MDSIKDTTTGRARQKLIDTEVKREENGRLVFQRDYLFSSPSSTASAVTCRSANGWVEWEQNGRTLDGAKRHVEEAVANNK